MARKKESNVSKKTTQGKGVSSKTKPDREKKIMNSIVNMTIILMSTMMGAFTEIMVKTTGTLVSGMAGALGGEETEKEVSEEVKQKLPEVDEKMKIMISDIRKDVYVQLEQKSKKIAPLLSDPIFDVGPKTIEKYDFKLPKLTEELDDDTLAQYTQLLVSENPNFRKMFKKLASWMNNLPKSPSKD
jgi:hypothetical protein